jgi:choline dehydrogenase-like flavoprotein
VLFSGDRCTAVQYSVDGKLAVAECAGGGEVVLAAGTVGSAQLLLSGIGPSAHLREHGIPVVVDLPGVGENLHDHPSRRPAPLTPPSTGDDTDARSVVGSSCPQFPFREAQNDPLVDEGGSMDMSPGVEGPRSVGGGNVWFTGCRR